MKVAISSNSFGSMLVNGGLTQLEWLERCASGLGADGIVFGRSHFPRTDDEYIAQLKKVAVDLGLVPLAIDEPELFATDIPASGRHTAIDLAAGIGALFVLSMLPAPGDVPPATFVATVGAAKAAVKAAKLRNITLLAQLSPGTLAQDPPELRHFVKDVDSAWLRYALPVGADRTGLSVRDRTLLVTVDPVDAPDALAEIDEAARPWLLLTGPVNATRIEAIRRAAAKKTLTRAGVS